MLSQAVLGPPGLGRVHVVVQSALYPNGMFSMCTCDANHLVSPILLLTCFCCNLRSIMQ